MVVEGKAAGVDDCNVSGARVSEVLKDHEQGGLPISDASSKDAMTDSAASRYNGSVSGATRAGPSANGISPLLATSTVAIANGTSPRGNAAAPVLNGTMPYPKGTTLDSDGPTADANSTSPDASCSPSIPNGSTPNRGDAITASAGGFTPDTNVDGDGAGIPNAIDTATAYDAPIRAASTLLKKIKTTSEAARWLARVRAKIAQMDAARALAADQSSAREVEAAGAQQRYSEAAQRRARYGPGHVPRRPSPSKDTSGVVENKTGEISSDKNGGRGQFPGQGEEDAPTTWKVPRPPSIKFAGYSPAMIMNNYAMRAKFQVRPCVCPPPSTPPACFVLFFYFFFVRVQVSCDHLLVCCRIVKCVRPRVLFVVPFFLVGRGR